MLSNGLLEYWTSIRFLTESEVVLLLMFMVQIVLLMT